MDNHETDKIDIVVAICKSIKGLTYNRFCEICDEYNVNTVEERRQVQLLIDGNAQHTYMYGNI